MSAGRRRIVAGGVAAAALAGGAGWAVWRERREQQLHEETAGVWRMRFETPGGGTIDMASLRGRPLVLNFWATWCPPCIEELPDLDRFRAEWAPRGWQVVGLAIDAPGPVRSFLERTPLGFPVGLAGLDGTGLARALGNAAGGLPFTVLFGSAGRVVHRKLGQTHLAELRQWAQGIE